MATVLWRNPTPVLQIAFFRRQPLVSLLWRQGEENFLYPPPEGGGYGFYEGFLYPPPKGGGYGFYGAGVPGAETS